MAQTAILHPASTVVLVRPDPSGNFEILMNRRPDTMDTYAGIYVFPGGRVETTDWSPAMLQLVRGPTPLEAQQILSSELAPELCLGHWVAAVRELFEEAGIQLFRRLDGALSESTGVASFDRLAEKRSALQQGEIDLSRLLEAEQLVCDLNPLNYFFHRITPDHYPVRFDTRFYLAALPQNQDSLHVSEEVSESLWVTPQAALDRHQTGSFPMMPPTLAVLRTLVGHRTWVALCAAFALGKLPS
jgi:8-oxo-dGTP pyrophosphatase MutT (NUDIX family)